MAPKQPPASSSSLCSTGGDGKEKKAPTPPCQLAGGPRGPTRQPHTPLTPPPLRWISGSGIPEIHFLAMKAYSGVLRSEIRFCFTESVFSGLRVLFFHPRACL